MPWRWRGSRSITDSDPQRPAKVSQRSFVRRQVSWASAAISGCERARRSCFFWAQRNGWGEQTEPLALLHQAQYLANEISFSHFSYHLIDWNLVSGLFGAVFLAVAIDLLLRRRNEIAPEAIVWVLGIAFLTVTSEHVPPNPRMLLTAFPAVLVFTSYLRARWVPDPSRRWNSAAHRDAARADLCRLCPAALNDSSRTEQFDSNWIRPTEVSDAHRCECPSEPRKQLLIA